MKEKNSFLIEQEKQANRLAAQVMQVTFLFFSLTYVLNLIGIFKVDKTISVFIETDNTNYHDGELLGASIYDGKHAYYINKDLMNC